MIFKSEERIYKSFVISICLVVALSISGVFLGISIETRRLIFESLRANARVYFETIVATRLWNAGYGGVYVEKKAGVDSNPYIENPDIETKDGKVFTVRNPAMMTREISEYVGKDNDFSFHITSKNLLNPHNRPDEFELQALTAFETGAKEMFRTQEMNGALYYRYMAPLFIKEDCLQCHRKQGYKVGDVRGGISVNFNIDAVQKKLARNTLLILVFSVTTTTLVTAAIWYLTRRLMRRITEIRSQLETMAAIDGLTGAFNRRYVLLRFQEEFERTKRAGKALCCMMLDIDQFKDINDSEGHLSGDEVLKETARRIKAIIRSYDLLGRYGGDEFIVIIPEVSADFACGLAERINHEVKSHPIENRTVTVSLGLTFSRSTDADIDDIIRRADEKLYEAKRAGRDCLRYDLI